MGARLEAGSGENPDPVVRLLIQCLTCQTTIGVDRRRVIDKTLLVLAIASHVDHPRSELTVGIVHKFQTVIYDKDGEVIGFRDGVNLTYDDVEL